MSGNEGTGTAMNGTEARPERTTLVLASDVNAWLDTQCIRMRQTTGTAMSRSEFLRAMVRATAGVAEADPKMDFAKCRTEEDIGLMMFTGELG